MIDISAEEIRQYIYCKRIIYFRRVFQASQRSSYSMNKGVKYDQKKWQYDPVYKGVKEIIRGRIYYHQNLHLRAKPDLVKLSESYLEVVEFKRYPSNKVPKGHIMQAYAGGVAASFELKIPFKMIIIEAYNGRTSKLLINNWMENYLSEILKEMRKMIVEQNYPSKVSEQRKCDNCEFWGICKGV